MLRDLRTPFGGVKQSGVGREGGWEALRFFTEAKNVCIKQLIRKFFPSSLCLLCKEEQPFFDAMIFCFFEIGIAFEQSLSLFAAP
jgi:hypothetical protein